MSGERTEKASPQKKKKAEERGDRLVSRELLAASAMLAGVLCLRLTMDAWTGAWRESYRASLGLALASLNRRMEPLEAVTMGRSIASRCLSPLVFFGLCSVAAVLVMGMAQGGGRLTAATLAPSWAKVNPGAHLKTVFGMQALVRLGKSLIPASVVIAIAVAKIIRQPVHPAHDLRPVAALFSDVYILLLTTAIAMAAWSGIDWLNSWRMRESRLKMTKQDVKDEMKEAEGSPQIKRRIRQLQRQNRRRQLRADVRKATVLLTNPTHYAVALTFDFVRMEPPRVLAKGQNLVARQMREEARWAGVPIIENPSLARSLYRSVEPGQAIPFELYAAVAGILAYLYRKELEANQAARREAAKQAQPAARRREQPTAGGSGTRPRPGPQAGSSAGFQTGFATGPTPPGSSSEPAAVLPSRPRAPS